jgi:hypothetical protein
MNTNIRVNTGATFSATTDSDAGSIIHVHTHIHTHAHNHTGSQQRRARGRPHSQPLRTQRRTLLFTYTHTHTTTQGVNKGALVGHILSHYGLRGGLDFIMCLGDDSLDTGMYSLLRDFVNNQGSSQQLSLFACTVGKQPSVATHCLYTLEVRWLASCVPHTCVNMCTLYVYILFIEALNHWSSAAVDVRMHSRQAA